MPRREGGRGTEITTLPAGQNLGEMQDVQYFQEKLYRSLNIPISRLMTDSGFNMGRASEITRDEIKFTKFIQRLRKRFTSLFNDMLKTQCLLKGVCTQEDWDLHKEYIQYDWNDDNYFFELKDSELLKERMEMLSAVTEYVGTYYSVEWVKKNILKQTKAEMEDMHKQIEGEKAAGEVDPDAGTNMGGPEGGFGDPNRGVEQDPWWNDPEQQPDDDEGDIPDADEDEGFINTRNGNKKPLRGNKKK